jgi:hypothetical protein
MMHIFSLATFVHIVCWTWAICSVDAQTETLVSFPFVSLDLTPVFDNVAAAPEGSGLANFDSKGASFDSQFLPTGKWVYDGVTVRRIALFFSFQEALIMMCTVQPSGILGFSTRQCGSE